jgi:hypothetical protein
MFLFLIISGKSMLSYFLAATRDVGGRNSVVGIATRYVLEGSNPDGARFSGPVQTGPKAHQVSCTGFLSRG